MGKDNAFESQSQPSREVIITDRDDVRRPLVLPAGELTMEALVEVLKKEKDELSSRRVDTLLFSRISIMPTGDQLLTNSLIEGVFNSLFVQFSTFEHY